MICTTDNKLQLKNFAGEDFNCAAAEHDRSNWNHRVVLDEDGVIDSRSSYGNGIPFDEHQGRALCLCVIPDGTADVTDLVDEIESLLPRLDAVYAGLTIEVHHDGNRYGTLTDEAEDEMEAVRELLDQYLSSNPLPSYWSAGDWLSEHDDETIDAAHDPNREQRIEDICDEARSQGVHLHAKDVDAELDDIAERYCARCHSKDCDCAEMLAVKAKMDALGLTWLTPPDRQGQAVLISYANDGETGVYRRIVDQSYPPGHPQREQYEMVPWDKVRGESEPWNGDPDVDEDDWQELRALEG